MSSRVCFFVSFFSILYTLAVRRRVGTLNDVQPRLVLQPRAVRLGLVSFPFLDVDVFFILDCMGISYYCASLSWDVRSSPGGGPPKLFYLCV